MALRAGDSVGPYEILAPLGAGGMGEVYRARDPRLGREVAIKVLRAKAMLDTDNRRRFEIEARAASGLNHPNILTIHDIGEQNGEPYMVSELLQGQTLREAVKNSTVSLRTLLDIAVQVTDALATAHAAGITHRDLKPENLFVLPDGRVKILDFGLAKSAIVADLETGTISDTLTSPGMILGTIAYMSPEQARGLPVDFRSDQFSIGTILYEMATGKRPFQGADPVSTLAAIVNDEPTPVFTVNPQTPAPLRWLIERCLSKDPGDRYASTADLHRQLRDMRDHLSELSTSGSVAAAPESGPRKRRTWLTAALLGLAGLVAGVLAAVFILHPASIAPAPHYVPFATEAIDESQPAWSPDGQTVAYIGVTDGIGQILTRGVSSSLTAQITKARVSCASPFWSHDGTHIYYQSEGDLWSVGAVGGTPQVVLRGLAVRNASASISPDGSTLAFFRTESAVSKLFLWPMAGGDPVAVNRPPFPQSFRFADGVQFSPDGKKLAALFRPGIGVDQNPELWIIPLSNSAPRRVPVRLGTGMWVSIGNWFPDNRHLVFTSQLGQNSGLHLYTIDVVSGEIQSLTSGTREESQPAVSSDGARIAFASGGSDYDLIEMPLDGQTITPLLATSRREYSASWSPSGMQYTYVSNASGMPGIWLRSVAESWPRPLVTGADDDELGNATPKFSPDGQRIAYAKNKGRHDIWISGISGGAPVPLEQESSDQHAPAWSPDGDWIVYTRFVNQKWEIAKAPSGGGGKPRRLCDPISSNSSNVWIEWSTHGDWIGFRQADGIHLVSAGGGPTRRVHGPAAAFTLSRDGTTLYLIRRAADRHWELASLGVPDGAEKTSVRLNISPDDLVRDMSLHPSGNRFVISIGSLKRDIWILDGFAQKHGVFGR